MESRLSLPVENMGNGRVRGEDDRLTAALHGDLQGVQTSHKGIEFLLGDVVVCLGEDAHILCLALCNQDFRFLFRLGEHYGDFLIRGIADLLSFRASLRGVGGGNVVALGDHALIDGRLVVAGQIELFGLKGEQLDTVLIQRSADIAEDGLGESAVPAGDYLILGRAADHVFRRVVDNGVQPALGCGDRAVQGLGELGGIRDMPEDVAVTDHGLLVAGDDVRGRQIIQQGLPGQRIRGLDKGKLKADAGLRYHVVDGAELTDQTVFVLLRDDDAGEPDN